MLPFILVLIFFLCYHFTKSNIEYINNISLPLAVPAVGKSRRIGSVLKEGKLAENMVVFSGSYLEDVEALMPHTSTFDTSIRGWN